MEQKTMEVVLKYYREKYHLRQEDICRGICSVTTLSRLEQGSREVDSLLGQTLLGRIGKEVTLFETILSEQDYELWKMREQIEKSVENNQVKTAEKKIREYRAVMPQDEKVHEQYCLYQEARTMIAEKNTGSSLCEILEKGICLTIPEFGKSMEKVRLYSPVEIGMILLLIHYDPSKTEMAEQELLNILEYVSGYQSGSKKEKVSTDIFFELISIQQRKNDYKKIMFYTEKVIQCISEGAGFYHLADIYFLRAKTREKLTLQNADKNMLLKKAVEECKIAACLYQLEGQDEKAREAVKYCEGLVCQTTEPGT